MRQSTTSTIKREQRKSYMLREVASLLHTVIVDNPSDKLLQSSYITKTDLSADGGICYIYFWNAQGEDEFKKARQTLILYKPSLRAALAKTMKKRYTPDLVFLFDATHAKEMRINQLLDQVGEENHNDIQQ